MSSQLEQTWLPLCRLVAYRAGLTFPRWPLDAAAVAAASDGTTRLRAGAPDHPRRLPVTGRVDLRQKLFPNHQDRAKT
jgi:hypothetical protein